MRASSAIHYALQRRLWAIRYIGTEAFTACTGDGGINRLLLDSLWVGWHADKNTQRWTESEASASLT